MTTEPPTTPTASGGPTDPIGGAVRLVVVVAHPDDESFGCGSVLAAAAEAGAVTTVVCATRGEAGESEGLTGAALGRAREAELRAAADVLGVRHVIVLDHLDSGMDGDPPPGSLAAVPPDQLVEEIGHLLDAARPDIVVTLDGSDGHRDHAVVRDATVAAVDRADHPPAATWLSCLARSAMERWVEHMAARSLGEAYTSMPVLGTPDEDITVTVDTGAHVATRWRAIRCHASQTSPFVGLPPALEAEFLAVEHLRLVRGEAVLWPGAPVL